MRYLLTILCLLPSLAIAQSRLSEADARILQDGLIVTADRFVQPAYQEQADALSALVDTLAAYCEGRDELSTVHAAFSAGFLAWQRASIIQYGPIAEAEGILRVQLWPDPKGFARRAVQSAVRAEDPSLVEAGALEGRSVALVNLTALEHLLYGAFPSDSYACELATAIAGFQRDLAEDLAADWTAGSEFRNHFDTASAGNTTYGSVDAVFREMLSGAVVYTDRLRKFKLLRGLGDAPGAARAERTEATKSGLGLASIEVAFRAIRDLYETPYGAFDVVPDLGGSMEYYMLSETAGNIADDLSIETRDLLDIAKEDGARADELRGYAALLLYHESFLKSGLLQSIGLTSGFTAADGD